MSEYRGGWFGASWGAPVCEPHRHKPTPVGQACVQCNLPILEQDSGMLLPYDDESALIAYHLWCFFDMMGFPGWAPK